MFKWLRILLPEGQKKDPSVAHVKNAIVEAQVHLAEVETELSEKVVTLRKDRVAHSRALSKAMDEVVMLIQSERRK